MNSDSPRILICRLSAIGDCVLTMPMLCALRRAYPRAFIAWATQRPNTSLLENHPALDEVIEIKQGFLRKPQALLELRRTLRRMRFEVAIDPQSLTKSAAVAWLSGAPRRIGNAPPLGRELSRWLNNSLVETRSSHIVDHHRELLGPLGVELGPVEFRTPLDPHSEARMATWIGGRRLDRFAVLNPGAGWPTKVWPAERFAVVAAELNRQRGMASVVVWAGDEERGWAETIVKQSQGGALLAPATRLPELTALLRRARLFVGSDTGPMHMAVSVDTPCVALYGPTRPDDCGPYGAGHVVVQRAAASGRRHGENTEMLAIEPSHVVAACLGQIDRERSSAA